MITDNDIQMAVATVQHVPDWRKKVAELMYTSVEKVSRIQHNKLKKQDERSDFITAIKNLLHNEAQ